MLGCINHFITFLEKIALMISISYDKNTRNVSPTLLKLCLFLCFFLFFFAVEGVGTRWVSDFLSPMTFSLVPEPCLVSNTQQFQSPPPPPRSLSITITMDRLPPALIHSPRSPKWKTNRANIRCSVKGKAPKIRDGF